MITVIVIFILGESLAATLAWGLIHEFDRRPELGDWVFFCFLMVMGSLLSGLVGFGASALVGTMADEEMQKVPTVTQLASLRSGDTTNGTINGGLFLIVGSVSGDRTFYYYEQQRGRLAPGHLNGDQGIYIYEEDRQDAVLEQYNWDFKKKWIHMWTTKDFGHTYYFRVPKGTVQRDMSLK